MQVSLEQIQFVKDAATTIVIAGAGYAALAMKERLGALELKLTGEITKVKEVLMLHSAETSAELREHKAEDRVSFTAIKDSLDRIERHDRR